MSTLISQQAAAKRLIYALVIAWALPGWYQPAAADESVLTGLSQRFLQSRWFAVTRMDGKLQHQVLTRTRERDSQVTGVVSGKSHGETTKAEIKIGAYVYHPRLVNMTIGVGFDRVHSTESGSEGPPSETSSAAPSLEVQLNILDRKPYASSVYFQRATSASFSADSVTEHNQTSRGFRSGLTTGILPFDFTVEANVTDKTITRRNEIQASKGENFAISMKKSFGPWHSASIGLSSQKRLNLDKGTETTLVRTRGTSNHLWGMRNQIQLKTKLDATSQTDASGMRNDQVSFSPEFNWDVSDALKTAYSLEVQAQSQEGFESTSIGQATNVEYQLSPWADVSLQARIQREQGNRIENSFWSVGGSASISEAFSTGLANWNSSFDVTRNDLNTSIDSRTVLDEIVKLSGTDRFRLKQANAIVDSIVVSTFDESVTFVEGVDYRLITAEEEVEIERLIFGAIEDGEEVRIKYQYRLPGSGRFTQVNHRHSLRYTIANMLVLTVRYHDGNVRVPIGSSVIGPVPRESLEYLIDLKEYRLSRTSALSGKLERRTIVAGARGEERRSQSLSALGGVVVIFPAIRTNMRLNLGWADSSTSALEERPENPRRRSMSLDIGFLPRPATRANLGLSRQIEYGGDRPIEQNIANLGFSWGRGRLSLNAQYSFRQERFNDVKQQISSVRATVRRSF